MLHPLQAVERRVRLDRDAVDRGVAFPGGIARRRRTSPTCRGPRRSASGGLRSAPGSRGPSSRSAPSSWPRWSTGPGRSRGPAARPRALELSGSRRRSPPADRSGRAPRRRPPGSPDVPGTRWPEGRSRRGNPRARPIIASAMPVFPDVASRIVLPAVRRPRSMPSTIMARAGRSLTLPPGFRCSALASSRSPGTSAAIRSSRSIGVPPIAWRRVRSPLTTLPCIF